MLEVRQGRAGTTGVPLDDLVDIRQGLDSLEFKTFCKCFKKEVSPDELMARALVLSTPSRTFSFLFNSEAQRDLVGQFIVYTLKSTKRGVMADDSGCRLPTSGHGKVLYDKLPKSGQGKVLYQNRSTYEGQFQNYMRHGRGTLTLVEGTKYECEWRNDERHGEGK